jgi:DNA-binding CsgD family transcriptional regulator
MRFTLGPSEIAQLQKTLETILTPIAESSPEAWGSAVMKDVKALLGADQAFFALPLDASVHITGNGERTAEAARAYETDYWRFDFLVGQRRKELGLEVHHQNQLYRPGETRHDILFNEWCAPNRLFDTLGMAVEVSKAPIPAGINVYHDRPSGRAFGHRGQALMGLLLPAFKASVLSYSNLIRIRESISSLVDHLRDGACIFSKSGQIVHENPSLQNFLATDRDPQLLRSAIEVAAVSLARTYRSAATADDAHFNRAFQRVRTISNVYEISVTRLGDNALPNDVAGIVFVAGLPDTELDRRAAADAVKSAFRLTSRELEVALLLSQRLSTNEIAARLGISTHTARHHIEKVLEKTGVSSRSLIAGLFERETS